MKKSIAISTIILVMSFSVVAEKMERQKGTTSSQMRSSQQTQVMPRHMVRNMHRIMQQIQVVTRDMNRIMENEGSMNQTRTREMARAMEQLSLAMRRMSQIMAKGEMDKDRLKEMDGYLGQINTMIRNMEQKRNQ